MAATARGEEEGSYKREGELEERKRTREKEEPGARKTNGEGGHLRKIEERHHLIPPSYLCISKREFMCVRTYVQSPAKVFIRHMCEKIRRSYFYKTYRS